MTSSSQEDFMYLAVVRHIRSWLSSDADFLDRVRKSKPRTKLDPELLRSIATEYQVGRGIPEGNETDLSTFLSDELQQHWPKSLAEQGAFVSKLAESAKHAGHTRYKLRSGLSKLIWFVFPAKWTMYDKYAAIGLSNGRTPLEIEPFYEELAELRFVDSMAKMREVISNSTLPFLWPERILDKYLMACGTLELDVQNELSQHNDFMTRWRSEFDADLDSTVRSLVDDLNGKVVRGDVFTTAFQRRASKLAKPPKVTDWVVKDIEKSRKRSPKLALTLSD